MQYLTIEEVALFNRIYNFNERITDDEKKGSATAQKYD